ncbi:hypothetical protein [Cyanobium sp. BSA11S]|uniref:hypothetical protein n=1 Tax=Cyanobium sp. BSA11S TaxID=3108224 RepID=UPI003D81B026
MTFARLLPPLGALLGAVAVAVAVAPPRPLARAVPTEAPPQVLPLEAEWCLEGTGGCIQLEVPRTERQFSLGLMQRPPLGPLRGMWFRFDPPSRRASGCIAPSARST